MSNTGSVPEAARPAYEAVVALTDALCTQRLDAEWAALCRQLAAALARKRPSPLPQGKAQVWASGILHALGYVNFLSDKSQALSMSVPDMAAAFGVSQSSMTSKSRQIREWFRMVQFDPTWTLPSLMDKNPLAWMISVNGLIIDVRHAPPEVQAEAFRRGLIPYIPTRTQDNK